MRHVKVFLLLRVLPVLWSSLRDDLLNPGLVENLDSCDVSKCIWLLNILLLPFAGFHAFIESKNSQFNESLKFAAFHIQ